MNSLNLFKENLFSYALMLGSKSGGGKLVAPSGSVACISGLPYATENYLVLEPSDTPFDALRLISFLKASGLPFVAPVLPGIQQKLLSALDESQILPVLTFTAMSIDLSGASKPGAESALLRVTGEDLADTWGRVVWDGFDSGGAVTKEYLSLARHMANLPENRLYLFCEEDTPVSSAMLHFTERSCGLYYFSTIAGFRRRGYAKRLMQALADEAAREYGELVLLATPEGLPFYRSFGFRTLAEISMRSNSRVL